MTEFDFIELLRPLAGQGGLGLLDDAAILKPSSGKDIVLSNDTMVEGIHFPQGHKGGGFSERLLRTALSDLAAKGARPIGYMLSVAWPKGTEKKWITGFVKGLEDVQAAFDLQLLGGDTTSTSGPLVATATVFGEVPSGEMVLRSGAKVGDDLWFTGKLGLAEKGLEIIQGQNPALSPDDRLKCEEAYLRPEPRFLFRKTLRKFATAAADISDGLLSEAGHIAKASGVAIDLDAAHLDGASFGDDYELLFTAAPRDRAALMAASEKLSLPITQCGRVISGQGLQVNGQAIKAEGYKHKF